MKKLEQKTYFDDENIAWDHRKCSPHCLTITNVDENLPDVTNAEKFTDELRCKVLSLLRSPSFFLKVQPCSNLILSCGLSGQLYSTYRCECPQDTLGIHLTSDHS